MKLKAIFKCRTSRFITLWSLLCLLLSSHSMLVNAQDDNHSSLLMPKPQQITENGTSFTLNRNVNINDETHSTLLASLFNVDNEATATVTVNIVDAATLGTFDYTLAGFDNEGYKMNVTADAITITAVSKTGVIRAAQTLMQLAAATEGVSIPGVDITDYPAFKLRGYMHDVGRSFISFSELKKEIDLLSRFKVNVFHWHLTDNQGFRFESKLYPQLNQSSAMTRFAGSYYTQEQCTELEAYAAERGVTVIPEIDMPGHSKAFTTAMGYSMSSDEGKVVLKDLLNELAAAFPLAPYIHMGADEAGTTAAFVNEMSQYIKETLHRRCIVWNPISGVTINTTNLPYIDMTEMWSTSGSKIDGVPNIDCRYNYINHFDVFADLVGIYKSNVYYAQQGSSEVAGAITAIWNDRKTATETDIISQNGLYAHALATAERGWMGGGNQYIEVGGTTLPNSGSEYEEFADWERRFLHYKDTWLSEEPIPYVKQTNVKWRITQAFPNGGTASTVFPPETATDNILPDQFTYGGKTYTTSMATGAGIYLRHVWGTTVPAFYNSPVLNTTAYAWTYIYSPTEQTAGALIEFQNYSRSENDKAPDAGNWDRKGSRIWVNGEEVLPPTWTNSGKNINSEVDLGNENFPAREPISIHLNAGWNKVLLKLPYVSASNIRLNKWMFTFVLTDLTGRNALDGIVYSPIQSLDENVEGVVSLIGEVKQYVNENCGTAIGYYPLSAASTLMEKVEEIEGTLQVNMTAEEREAQVTALEAAFTTFKNGLSSQTVNQPLPSTLNEKHYYTLCTPLRGTRYVTASGTTTELAGATSVTDASYWKFVTRTDGTLDIVNAINGSYIAPNSTNNTALMTQVSQPSSGWTLSKAATAGYVIISSGSCQFNQTNNNSSALSGAYRVFNWGGGNNTSDTGCQYLVEEADIDFDGTDVLDGSSTSDGTRVLTVGSQVTTEAGITSGKVYILKTGSNAYITESGTYYSVPNSANSATEASAYYLISNGNGTWKIKNYHTGKYWGVPTYNSALTPVEEASAGAWSLNFSNGIAYPSAPDANSTTRGIDRSSQKVWGWNAGTGNNAKVYIYEVPLSTVAAFDEFSDKDLLVGTTPESTISTGIWYVMSQRSRTSYVYEDASSHTLKHTQSKPNGLATTCANYLIRLVAGTDGKYYLQNGLGNYMGQITASTNVPTTAMRDIQHTVAKINGASGHYYIQCASNNVILDANDFTLGDPSTVVGWGTTPPTGTGGNNDWAFYPVEFVDSWIPAIDEVYTINNTNTSRGAMMYNGSSDYVWSSGKSGTFDATAANCQWVLVPTGTDKQYYLYNVGAQKFAVPSGTASTASWVFSTDAVAVTLIKQSDGTFKIKTATTDTYAAVSNGYNGPIINYNDVGGNFTITKVDGNQSTGATAALNKLMKNQTALTAAPEGEGWYAVRIKAGNYANEFVYAPENEVSYSGRTYPLTFMNAVNKQPAIYNTAYLCRIEKTENGYAWQLPNGLYLQNSGSNYFPTSTTTAVENVQISYANGFKFSHNNGTKTDYAVAYYASSVYFIGESDKVANGTLFDIYPIDIATAGMTAWKVSINNNSGSKLTCTRSDVIGQTSAYHNGYIFLPTGVTPVTGDFTMDGMVGDPVVDTENHSVSVTYDPTISLLTGNVSVIQGNQTTGKGNTMQALLRVKLSPFKACTLATVNVTLTGADQLERIEAYTTANDELRFAGVVPTKINTTDINPAASVEIPVNAALAAGQSVYLWITGDVKSDATEWATIDAAITSIEYSNDYTVAQSQPNSSLNITSVGNPNGAMRIYKQQSELWTASRLNTKYYRIPTIMNTADGGIVAFTDDRYSSTSDLGNHKIDVVVRKSMNNGLTWGEEKYIAVGDGTSEAAYGYGDAAVVRTLSGKLICLMASGRKGFFSGMEHVGYVESTDNGVTWSAPVDIYGSIDKAGHAITSGFPTAGKGVTFSNGRVAFAMNGMLNGGVVEYILYSDDEGATWKMGTEAIFTGADESKLEIMNDNSLLVSVRRGSYNSMANRGYNRTTGDASGDGINTWGTQGVWGNEMNANGCNADILYYNRATEDAARPDVILHTLTKDYNAHRRDLRLNMSFDQGRTWKEAFQLQPGWAAYSSMLKLDNGDLAIIYEDGSIGNEDAHDCFAINYIVISKEMIEAKIDELYEQEILSTATIISQGETNGSAPWGSWSPASGWANTFTTNANSGVTGVVVSASYNAFNRQNGYDQRVFIIKPSAAGAQNDVITITAPDGYLIDGYTIGGYFGTSSETYRLTAEDGTFVNINRNKAQENPPTCLMTSGLNSKTTTITLSNSNSTNNNSAFITNFTVTLTNKFILSDSEDNTAAITAASGQNRSVILADRTLYKDGAWNTLCVPFSLDASALLASPLAGATIVELDEEDGDYDHATGFEEGTLYLNFKKADGIEAGKPYLVKWEDGNDLVNPRFLKVSIDDTMTDVTSTDGYITFQGTYAPVDIMAMDKTKLFMSTASTLYYPSKNMTIGCQRAYFQLNNGLTAGDVSYGVRSFVLNFGEGETTGINSIDNGQLIMDNGAVYDLQGRRVVNPSRGLYIVNGKKVVIK